MEFSVKTLLATPFKCSGFPSEVTVLELALQEGGSLEFLDLFFLHCPRSS